MQYAYVFTFVTMIKKKKKNDDRDFIQTWFRASSCQASTKKVHSACVVFGSAVAMATRYKESLARRSNRNEDDGGILRRKFPDKEVLFGSFCSFLVFVGRNRVLFCVWSDNGFSFDAWLAERICFGNNSVLFYDSVGMIREEYLENMRIW